MFDSSTTYKGDWYTYRFSAVVVASGWVRRCKDSGSTLQGRSHTALRHANALLLHRLQKCVLIAADPEGRK